MALPLIELRGVETTYRTGKLEYAAALNQDATDHLVLYATQQPVQELGGFHGVNMLQFLPLGSEPSARLGKTGR